MSALSVIFTIVVLDVYFNSDDEEEVPEWLQKFTNSVLVRIMCWNTTCCKSKQVAPFNEKTSLKIEKDMQVLSYGKYKDGTKDLDSKGKNKLDTASPEKDIDSLSNNKVYTWKEIALLMDRCFLFAFIFLVVTASVVCLALLASAYHMY